jgi:hypothetical protein
MQIMRTFQASDYIPRRYGEVHGSCRLKAQVHGSSGNIHCDTPASQKLYNEFAH